MIRSLTLLLSSFLACAAVDMEIEIPSVFNRGKVQHCEDNSVVASWCDSSVFEDIECGLLPQFDEYGCQCYKDPSKCPSECVGGSELVEKTHYGIVCRTLPNDSPNYILKEYHKMTGCEDNAVVAAWCDDYVNLHIECGLYPEINQYLCKCSGKVANCPLECVDGSEPLVKTQGSVLCSGIPADIPNYILKEPTKKKKVMKAAAEVI
jgi:hypothetical protein